MASAINISNITSNPLEVQSMGEFIVERAFGDKVLNSIHAVWTGVKMKQQIGFASRLGHTGILDSGCARPSTGAKVVFSEKYTEPVKIGDTIIHCQAEVDSLFKAYGLTIQRYVDLYDISGSELEVFFTVMLSEAAMETVWRLVWCGDKGTVAAGAAQAGVAVAANAPLYTPMDGIFAQIFDGVTAGDIPYVEISQNNEATIAAQTTLPEGFTNQLLEDMWAKADSRLRSDPNKMFLVTRELFENQRQYLTKNSLNFTIEVSQEGLQTIKWGAIPVINMEDQWRFLREHFVDNTTNNAFWLANRAILTVPANIPVMTLNEDDMTEIKVWYNEDDRVSKAAYGFTIDAKVLEEYMIVAAY